MGNAGYVFDRYISHVLNNVGSKPSMSFKKNGTPVTRLSSLYLIGDTNGATECYIDAHGGNYSADYVLDNQTFTVPDGIHVKFFQPAGYAFGCFKAQLRDGPPKQHGGTNDQDYDGGDTCPNYMLTKFQGRHSGADAQSIRDQEIDYEGFQDIAGDAGIVLVTVRNRWFHGGITLKSAIHDIRKAVPSITTFNCMFCRVDDTTASLAQVTWNASPTTGGQWY
ncbi:hypothetical protein GXW77_08460 [Roseomonas alkaliterrae]|uniref:Putative adhesin Stv domain-containing protein n=1 Tax=Neoroseomonas alkaliterrae TaxID=1452450 RepID=A0A840Y8A1_9PROT|nr:hypothetical protein [Neoroseomonas alkaliterrae]MBB5690094.1 hypothetical protein [Neoroseomonas alkaliterrae]MBR0676204.1 hypothetical protein [Neoroseomonas alkaliterrae]